MFVEEDEPAEMPAVLVEAPVVVVEQDTAPPVTQLPSTEPLVTAERVFVARKADPVVMAFLHAEGLSSGRIQKKTRSEWIAALEAFKAAPRG